MQIRCPGIGDGSFFSTKPIMRFVETFRNSAVRHSYTNWLLTLSLNERLRKSTPSYLQNLPAFSVAMAQELGDESILLESSSESHVAPAANCRPVGRAAATTAPVEQGTAIAAPQPSKPTMAPIRWEPANLREHLESHPNFIFKLSSSRLKPKNVQPISPSAESKTKDTHAEE